MPANRLKLESQRHILRRYSTKENGWQLSCFFSNLNLNWVLFFFFTACLSWHKFSIMAQIPLDEVLTEDTFQLYCTCFHSLDITSLGALYYIDRATYTWWLDDTSRVHEKALTSFQQAQSTN